MQSTYIFVGLPSLGFRKFMTPDSDSGSEIRLRLQDVMCDIVIVYLRLTWEKINLNSSNKRCTVVHQQKFYHYKDSRRLAGRTTHWPKPRSTKINVQSRSMYPESKVPAKWRHYFSQHMKFVILLHSKLAVF